MIDQKAEARLSQINSMCPHHQASLVGDDIEEICLEAMRLCPKAYGHDCYFPDLWQDVEKEFYAKECVR